MSAKRKATSASASGGARAGKNPGRSAGKGKPKSIPRRILKWFLLLGLAGMLLGGVALGVAYAATDVPDPNKDFQTQTTIVYYDNGKKELGRFADQNRISVPLDTVPEHVQDAVIAAENRTFWTDKGLDPKGILRAAFSNATSESTQGASTITQQYVKVLYLSQDRTLTRKAKEAFLSLKIQNQMSKEEILQGYLNTIYFGRGAYGIQAAAQAYFEKDAEDLSVREGAALASILNSPGLFDPADGADNRTRLMGRYQYVLDGMADMEVLDPEIAEKAAQKLPKFPKIEVEDSLGGPKGYLLALVKEHLRAEGFTDAEIEGGGLRVTTTISAKAQKAASRRSRRSGPPRTPRACTSGSRPSSRAPVRSRRCTAARTTSRTSATGPPPDGSPARRSSRSPSPRAWRTGSACSTSGTATPTRSRTAPRSTTSSATSTGRST